jgi:alkanesulfonate monooxygenase SsuD/methylene tetrahydromethanopterin reductase-like flavin-dependent oxidoreductase (luciferase family)
LLDANYRIQGGFVMRNKTGPIATMMMPLENRREAILELALTAEKGGYDAVFLPETWTFDTTVLLAEIAVRTDNIKVGSGILSIWGRSPGTFAMTSATLNKISGGRFILGLGSSTRQLVEGFHDVAYHAPYQKMRQIITQIRSLLQGERLPLYTSPDAHALQLNQRDYGKIPILLAASSDKSIEIAWDLCDGWIPFLFPRDHLKQVIFEKSEKAETDRQENWQVYPIIPTIVYEDRAKAREGASWVIGFYLNKMGPIYRNALKRLGYQAEVESVLSASKEHGQLMVPDEAEVLLEQLTLYGTPEEVKEQIQSWYQVGATMPCLMTNPNLSLEEIRYNVQSLV